MTYTDNRLESIFKCIVESYVETAIPVGSRIVSKLYQGGLSPASIRNVMADLEEMGLICQPHTSAGRVPTATGYRFYVDRFLDGNKTTLEPQEDWGVNLRTSRDVEDVAEKTSRILADTTHNAGLFFLKNVRRVSYIGTQPEDVLVDSMANRLYIEGTRHIVEQPEFNDRDRAYEILKMLELKEELKHFFEEEPADDHIHIYIGDEAKCDMPDNMSIVVKQCVVEGESIASLAVIGPTRMDYGRAIGMVSYLSDAVHELLSEY
ncbi:MAG: transcriptional regulator of heat shock response [Candidatus Omnitrophota bacterium]|jgi:transcriptional regulator of heat shock response